MVPSAGAHAEQVTGLLRENRDPGALVHPTAAAGLAPRRPARADTGTSPSPCGPGMGPGLPARVHAHMHTHRGPCPGTHGPQYTSTHTCMHTHTHTILLTLERTHRAPSTRTHAHTHSLGVPLSLTHTPLPEASLGDCEFPQKLPTMDHSYFSLIASWVSVCLGRGAEAGRRQRQGHMGGAGVGGVYH